VQPILFMVAWVYMPNQLNWFGFGHSAHVLLSTLPKDIHVRVVYPLTWKYKFLGFLIDVIPLILN
jgi:hypothetical protein